MNLNQRFGEKIADIPCFVLASSYNAFTEIERNAGSLGGIDQGIVLVIIISRQYRRLLRYIEVSRLTLMVPDVYQMRGSEVWNDCDEILFISVVIICLGNRLDYPVANKILNCCFMKEKRESVSLRWLQDANVSLCTSACKISHVNIYRSMYRRCTDFLLLTKGKRWFRITIMRVEICRSNE